MCKQEITVIGELESSTNAQWPTLDSLLDNLVQRPGLAWLREDSPDAGAHSNGFIWARVRSGEAYFVTHSCGQEEHGRQYCVR
jgi:hypothetical protein